MEERRLKAMSLLKMGKSYRQVAEEVGASLSSVVRWHQAFRKEGKKGLCPKPVPGRPGWLSAREKKQMEEILL